jgi:hypothetical protein
VILLNVNRHAHNANMHLRCYEHPIWRFKYPDGSVKYAWYFDILGHVVAVYDLGCPLDNAAHAWQEIEGEVILMDRERRVFAGVEQKPGEDLLY